MKKQLNRCLVGIVWCFLKIVGTAITLTHSNVGIDCANASKGLTNAPNSFELLGGFTEADLDEATKEINTSLLDSP